MSESSFSQLSLKPALLSNLATLGYEHMTPIQAQSLPPILAGRDVIGQGKTGSGKTAAFGLGLLHSLDVKRFYVQSIVLCPTRELADQVAKEIRRLARAIHNIKVLTLCGGMSFGPQIGSLEHGAHIIVGTPGRIEEHIRKGNLDLSRVSTVVLDEADRMLDMGFQAAMDAIVGQTPKQRQTLLFSATFPTEIQRIAQHMMRDPITAKVEATHNTDSIRQYFYQVDDNQQRQAALHTLLLHYRPESAVVFCNTKKECQLVADTLADAGMSAAALHGDLDQKQRDQTLVRFANKSASVLVATDVAARGLDVENLDMVVNYQMTRDSEVHVHRIGRTGRAGQQGSAHSLFQPSEAHKLVQLEDYLRTTIEPVALPQAKNLEPLSPPMVTLQIDGGKKQKVRPGDILGALTKDGGIDGKAVGKIHIFDFCAYVAVTRPAAKAALQQLTNGKLKGRSFRARLIRY